MLYIAPVQCQCNDAKHETRKRETPKSKSGGPYRTVRTCAVAVGMCTAACGNFLCKAQNVISRKHTDNLQSVAYLTGICVIKWSICFKYNSIIKHCTLPHGSARTWSQRARRVHLHVTVLTWWRARIWICNHLCRNLLTPINILIGIKSI